RGALAAEREQQHRERRSERVGDGEPDALSACEARRLGRDESEYRPAAGDEEQPQAGSEQEAAAEIARGPSGQAEERPLDRARKLRDHEGGREEEQERDRHLAEEVLRKAELVEQPADEEQRQDE